MNRTVLPSLFVLAACAHRGPGRPTAVDTSAADFTESIARKGVRVRASFDTDPSVYVGRFFKPGEQDLVESSAMELTCSKYISPREVSAGGVERDEYLRASTSAAANLGIPPALSASLDASRDVLVRVHYTETMKIQYQIDDADEFEACCTAAPDQCTDRYIGEFIGGAGRVWYAIGSAAELSAEGLTTDAVGDVEVKDGRVWKAGVTFRSPVYFAFTVADNVHRDDAGIASLTSGACDDPALTWDNRPPRTSQGQYFIGLSQLLPDEQSARDDALRNARSQAVRWVEEFVQYSGGSANDWETDGRSPSGAIVGGSATGTAATGIAERVKDVAWCREQVLRPTGGYDHLARVLVFMPTPTETSP